MRAMSLGRRAVAVAMSVVLVAGAAYAVVETAGDDALDCDATQAPTVDDALVLAVSCGHDVVALDSLDPRSSMTATPRGTVRLTSDQSAVRTDLSGTWEPVDPRIVTDQDSGELRVASPVNAITFSPVDGRGFVSIASDEGVVSLDVPMELGAPEVDGTRVRWRVLDGGGAPIEGVELMAQVHGDASGVTPLIEVRDARAYAALERAAGGDVGFQVVTSGGLSITENDSGGLDLIGESGQPVLEAAEPLQWDSSGGAGPNRSGPAGLAAGGGSATAVDAAVPVEGDVVAPMLIDVVDDTRALVTADEQMVEDPGTRWPLTIDPALSNWTLSKWLVVRDYSGWGSKYGSAAGDDVSGNEGVGYCAPASTCTQVHRSRAFWNFDLWALPYIEAADVVGATFRVHGTHSWSCTKNNLDLYLTSGFSASTAWSNQPATKSKQDTQTPTHYGSSCPGSDMDEWSILAAAKQYAGTTSEMTLGLRAASETAGSWWRYDMGSAQVQVEFNRAPSVPTSMQMIVGTKVYKCTGSTILTNDTRPQLSVVASDPDKDDRVAVSIQVYEGTSGRWEWNFDPKASGVEFAKTVPSGVLGSGVYRWRARARDTDGLVSPWTQWCTFTVDIDRPDPPTVTPLPQASDPAIEAEYWTDLETGGLGLMGCFELSTKDDDAKEFRYRFKNAAMPGISLFVGDTRKAKLCMTPGYPEKAGPDSLTVSVWDLAGNASTDSEYNFDVATAREDGVWSFDTRASSIRDDSREQPGEAGAGPLTVVDPTWVPGPHSVFGSRDGDWAMGFNGKSSQAYTQSSVFGAGESFVVAAHVNPETVSSRRAVVTQDGPSGAAWSVGTAVAGCPSGMSSCWAFWAYDPVAKTTKTVASSVPPSANQWTQLTAEYDEKRARMRLWVCEIGTPESTKSGEPVVASGTAPMKMQLPVGSIVLGRGKSSVDDAYWWKGQIDNVRLFKGEVVADAKIRRMCQGAEANQFDDGIDALDPTTKKAN